MFLSSTCRLIKNLICREMKRKREMEKESDIRSAIEELSIWNKLETEDYDYPNKIGPTMAVLRQDVHQNIQKIERVWESGTYSYGNLCEILKKEAAEGTLKKVHSCVRAILSLARQIALKLVPDNKNFMNLLMAKNESSQTLMEELKTMVSLLLPFLESLHSVLVKSSSIS